MTQQADFETAKSLFNQHHFFECHEVLEDLWRPLPAGAEKQFFQGVLQIAVGLHHLQKLNFTGARNKLKEGLEKLEVVASQTEYKPPISLTAFISQTRLALAEVLRLEQTRLGEFPPSFIPTVEPA